MALASMTGFARTQGSAGAWSWAWEIKSVNGKGLDVRLRLPGGWEGLEAGLKQIASRVLGRGSVNANLTMTRADAAVSVRVNEDVLRAIALSVGKVAADLNAPPVRLESLLNLKGVLEIAESEDSEAERRAAEQAVIAGFEAALGDLVAMRAQEGAALGLVLNERLDAIAALTAQAEANPTRQAEAIRAKLAEQIRVLMDTGANFDPDRLHQEALMLASKVDVREELDRLVAHVAAARAMLGDRKSVV